MPPIMTLTEIRKACVLCKDHVDGSVAVIMKNGEMALEANFKDGTQKVFEDIQHVIDWVQVQKIMRYVH